MPEKPSKDQKEKADSKSVNISNAKSKTENKTKSRLPNKSLTNAEIAEKKQESTKNPAKNDSNAKKIQKSQKTESNKVEVKVNTKKPTDKPAPRKEVKAKTEAKSTKGTKPQKSEPAKTSNAETIKVKTEKSTKPTPKVAVKKPINLKSTKIADIIAPIKPSLQSLKPKKTERPTAEKGIMPNTKSEKLAKPVKAENTTKGKKSDTQKGNFLAIFSRIIAGILGVSSIFFIITLIRLNVLPLRYLLLAVIVILTIAAGCGFALWRKKSKTALKIPVNIISIILSCIYFVGGGYITQANSFLDNLQTQQYISEQYYVIIKNNSSFADITDLENKTVGVFDEGLEIYQEAIKILQETVPTNLKTYDSVRSLTSDLLSDKLDAVLLSAVYKSVVDEDDAKFSQNTKILYTIEAKVKLDTVHEESNVDVTSEPFIVYISGNDSYGDLSSRGLSDVNMLATVNPVTHEILLTSIPRDYYVELHDTLGAMDKLTHAGMYGVQMSVQTIEDLLDININYYVKINFPALISLVDAIGGIDVYSDQRIKPLHGDGKIIEQGMNHLDGKLALAFARERMSYAWGDRHRVQNQRDVLNAIIKKVSSSTVILTKTNEILSSISSNLDTNIGKSEISSLVKLQLQDMPSWKVGEFMLNGQDAYEYTYTFNDQLRYVMHPDANSVQAAHNYITGILEGKSLDELNIPKQEPAPGQ